MEDSPDKIELLAKLADETLRANALSAELEAIHESPSWKVIELLRLRSRRTKKLESFFRRIAVFLLRLKSRFSKHNRPSDEDCERLEKRLLGSKLFDPDWYVSRYPDAVGDPVSHFLQIGGDAGANPGPLFETKWYQRCNPDIGAGNPLLHYLDQGAGEGRLGWSLQHVVEVQRPFFKDTKHALKVLDEAAKKRPFPVLGAAKRVCVFSSSRGNTFFTDIRDMICAGLQQAGIQASTGDETSARSYLEATPVVVAPHEFFYLGGGTGLQNQPQFSHALCVNTEQIQTPWFSRAFPFLARASGVLDFNVQTAALIAQLGMPCRFLTPGYLGEDEALGLQSALPKEAATESFGPAIQAPPPAREANLDSRALDILFVGANTPRREQFFARHASRFADKVCALHLTDMSRPITDGGGVGMSPKAYAGLSRRSKIQLNIHQGILPYFEWHRIILHGFRHRTAVVTETGFRTPGYEPGIDYFEDDLDKLPDLLDWLLRSGDGRAALEKVSKNAYEKLKNSAGMSQILADVFQIGKGAR